MPTPFQINVADNRDTTDATPIPLAVFGFPANSVALVKTQVFAVRSDLAVKAWTVESLIRKDGGGLEILEHIPTPPNIFASAADSVSLATVTIGLFSDETYVGINCTGQDGQDIHWELYLVGNGVTS